MALVSTLAGCAAGGAAVARPEATVEAYVRAVRAGDAQAAYALLDEATRSTLTPEDLARLMEENREELQEQGEELERRLGRGVEARAEVALPSGEEAVLVLEDGRWQLDGDVLGSPTLRTPRDAVMALRRSLMRRSLPGVVRVLARQPRAELEAEIERVLEETADELDLEYEVRGNTARVRTTGGREIQLIREAGEWRIVDVE